MVGLVLAVTVAVAAPCDESIDAATLESRALAAEQAWADMEGQTFVDQAAALRNDLECVSDALYPDQVAAWFRVQGMLHFFQGDRAQALADLRAALANDPDWQLGSDLAGADHPLHALIDEARASSAATETLSPASSGWIRIDGEQGLEIPVDRPFLFQRFDAEGRVVETWRIRAGNRPPAYDAQRPLLDALDSEPFTRYRRTQGRGQVVSGVGTLGFAVGTGLLASVLFDPGTPPEAVIGGTLMVTGAGAMIVGLPMQNIAATKERRMLLELGADPGLAPVTTAWALYGVALPTLPFLGLGVLPYLGAMTAAGEQTRHNRLAEERLRQGVVYVRRPQVAVGPLAPSRGVGLQLEVRGW